MASKQAANRLRKELKAISADPPPLIHVSCDESNILNWSYMLEGPPDTPYAGGWYWGKLKFPKDYPFKPPSILMMTPNGRFETNTRLCLSMSDYHPESWQPAWSLDTVLKGLLSFMCEESPTAGAIDPPPSNEERARFARSSLDWNKGQAEFMKGFPEVETIVADAETRKAQKASASSASAPTADDDRPPASAGAEASESPPQRRWGSAAAGAKAFAAGDAVRLEGLQSRKDLNGREGVIEDTEEVLEGRFQVLVGAERVRVKPESIVRLRGAADGGAAPEVDGKA
mmetsp:Transcript_65141/g.146946  ORF Transcript_65141/g.146946 Transcript_65141/m.146946 type:complete len:286 (-) Transcript_65141:175-1032(-)